MLCAQNLLNPESQGVRGFWVESDFLSDSDSPIGSYFTSHF